MICKIVALSMNHKLEFVYKLRTDGSHTYHSAVPTKLQYKVGDVVLCQFDQEKQSIIIRRQATVEDAWHQFALTKSQLERSEIQKSRVEQDLDDLNNALRTEKSSAIGNSEIVSAFGDWKNFLQENKDDKSNDHVRLIRSLSKLFLKALNEFQDYSEDERNQKLTIALNEKDWLKATSIMLSGADARRANERGDTSIMRSTKDKDYALTKFLLVFGVSPFEENDIGVSAANIARRRGDEKFLVLFRSFSSYAENHRRSSISHESSSSFREQLTLLQTQNQDEGSRSSEPTTSESTNLADAQYLQDMSSDQHDATRYWGQSSRDGGQFGSHPGMDDFGDESSP